MSMSTSFGTDYEMADHDSTDASGTLPCCAGPSVEQGRCLSVTNGFLMNYFSIAVVGQKIPLVTSVRFLSLWHAVALCVDSVTVVGLASLLVLLPLSAVVTSLMRGPHGIHTTSSSPQLSEACEDSALDDDVLSVSYPWQLLAKAESVVAHLFSPLLARAFLTVDLPTREQTCVRTVSHERAPPLP
jgi:hypothetical protein